MTAITSLQTDSLAALRNTAARDPKAAIKEAAKQFEGLFMQELMKSMRQATMSRGMLDNEGTQHGQGIGLQAGDGGHISGPCRFAPTETRENRGCGGCRLSAHCGR